MMSRNQKLKTLIWGLLSLLLVACHSDEPAKKSAAPALPKDQVLLNPNSPKRDYIKEDQVDLEQIPLMQPLTGTLAYDETRTAKVSSPIAGRVTGKFAALGAKLKAGDALATLDSPELGQAQADYVRAQADRNLAERNLRRLQELLDHGVAPRKEYEQAQDEVSRTRSEEERARLKLANLGVMGNRTDNRFTLFAPIAGEVTERNINPGMEVRPDLANPLFILSDLTKLWVLMDVYEKDIGLIHVGQQVTVRVQAWPGMNFPATVDYINRVVDSQSRTVKVRCVVANPDKKLLPAMYASVEVLSEPKDKGIIVPLDSLFTEGESDWVYVALDHNLYQKRPVTVGLRLKDRAVVTGGLKPGERLVIGGALLLRTEQDTEVQSGEAAP